MSQTSFRWVPIDYQSVFGNIMMPQAIVEIKAITGKWKVFYPEVDTGAVVSIFTECDCERLGLILKEGEPFRLSGVFGGSGQAYLHEVELKIGDELLKSRVAFTEGNHKQLLGRVDVMDNFRISLSGKYTETIFVRE